MKSNQSKSLLFSLSWIITTEKLNISNDWNSLCGTAIKSVKWNSSQRVLFLLLFTDLFVYLYICQKHWYVNSAPDAVVSVHVILR